MIVRFLGGTIAPFCQSCNQRPAVLSVRWPDFIIAVCLECRPDFKEAQPTEAPALISVG